ncbi:hypothetical protein FYJ24_08355 [Actinomycetaceae bacterium WB03_NA08]|uniref:Uncharacterized protein n=2 Tax=Actinomycetes TaxID=1760 RepID=A0A6N7W8D9_9ACTO|nr:hypothetical protein [Scrofimicrobium canadense]MSS84773.1 hypothetical protein [Scrofimicrobium canadense]
MTRKGGLELSGIDFDVREFARLLSTLPAHLPISDAMEQADPQKKGRWWSSQREHMSSWFDSQATTGSGSFTRQKPNMSARTTYNMLQHPEGLVWIAEALGVDTQLVQQVANDALAINRRSRSKFVRQHLPWDMIAGLAKSEMESRRR